MECLFIYTTIQKFWDVTIFQVYLLCSPRLCLFNKKYSYVYNIITIKNECVLFEYMSRMLAEWVGMCMS